MCRVKGCKEPAFARGVCARHYQQAIRLKKTHPKKFAVLEKNGILLPRYDKAQELSRLADSLLDG